jgi:uncharacterized protein YggE
MRPIISAIVVLLLTYYASAEMSLTGTPGDLSSYLSASEHDVTVEAQVEVKVPADRAVVQLMVTTDDKSLQSALKKNQTIRTDLKSALEKGGIAADRITGSRFSSTPSRGFLSDKVKSYRVTNSVKVTVSSEDEFQLVAGEMEKHPEITYQGIRFERADEGELKRKALAEACDAAIAKKHLIAGKLGMKLVVTKVSERVSDTTAMSLPEGTMAGLSAMKGGSAFYEAGAEAPAVSQFDEVTYIAEVTLVCRLEPKDEDRK